MKQESPGYVVLEVEGKSVRLPVVVGSEGEKGIDIGALRRETGYVTLDPSFMNTAACYSSITFIDGEKGILRYRGIPIEELVRKTMFVEVAYLLVHGELPNEEQRRNFSAMLNINSMLHEDMRHFFDHFPRGIVWICRFPAEMHQLLNGSQCGLQFRKIHRAEIAIQNLRKKLVTFQHAFTLEQLIHDLTDLMRKTFLIKQESSLAACFRRMNC